MWNKGYFARNFVNILVGYAYPTLVQQPELFQEFLRKDYKEILVCP